MGWAAKRASKETAGGRVLVHGKQQVVAGCASRRAIVCMMRPPVRTTCVYEWKFCERRWGAGKGGCLGHGNERPEGSPKSVMVRPRLHPSPNLFEPAHLEFELDGERSEG